MRPARSTRPGRQERPQRCDQCQRLIDHHMVMRIRDLDLRDPAVQEAGLAKEGGDTRQILKRICDIVKGPVSGEVVATDFAGMMREGHDIAKIDEHMIIKVPLTRDATRTPAGNLPNAAGVPAGTVSLGWSYCPRTRCAARRNASLRPHQSLD